MTLYTANIVHRIGAVETKLFVAKNGRDAFDQAYTYCMNRYGEKYLLLGELRITTGPTHVEGYSIEVRKVH